MANSIIQAKGKSSTEMYEYNLTTGVWSARANRPATAGYSPVNVAASGGFDGARGWAMGFDRKLYSNDYATDAWSGPIDIGMANRLSYYVESDGRFVYVAGHEATANNVDFCIYEIGTGNKLYQALTLGFGAGGRPSVGTISIAWDKARYIYLVATSSESATIDYAEIWRFDTKTMGAWELIYSNNRSFPGGSSSSVKGACVNNGLLYWMTVGGYLYSFDPATPATNPLAKTQAPGGVNTLNAAALYAVDTDKLVAMTDTGGAGDFKQYTISGNAWSSLPDFLGASTSEWAFGWFTQPLSDPFAYCDSSGVELASLPDFPQTRIGGAAVEATYYVKALQDVPACYVEAVQEPNIIFGVAPTAAGPFVQKTNLGAAAAGQVLSFVARAQATGGAPRTSTLKLLPTIS